MLCTAADPRREEVGTALGSFGNWSYHRDRRGAHKWEEATIKLLKRGIALIGEPAIGELRGRKRGKEMQTQGDQRWGRSSGSAFRQLQFLGAREFKGVKPTTLVR